MPKALKAFQFIPKTFKKGFPFPSRIWIETYIVPEPFPCRSYKNVVRRIAAVKENRVEVCVNASGKVRAADDMVRKVIADALNVPLDCVLKARGSRLRSKIIALLGWRTENDGVGNTKAEIHDSMTKVRRLLEEAIPRGYRDLVDKKVVFERELAETRKTLEAATRREDEGRQNVREMMAMQSLSKQVENNIWEIKRVNNYLDEIGVDALKEAEKGREQSVKVTRGKSEREVPTFTKMRLIGEEGPRKIRLVDGQTKENMETADGKTKTDDGRTGMTIRKIPFQSQWDLENADGAVDVRDKAAEIAYMRKEGKTELERVEAVATDGGGKEVGPRDGEAKESGATGGGPKDGWGKVGKGNWGRGNWGVENWDEENWDGEKKSGKKTWREKAEKRLQKASWKSKTGMKPVHRWEHSRKMSR